MNYFQTHPFFQKLTRKQIKKLSKGHTKLKKIHQSKDIGSLTETTQNIDTYENLKNELCLENEKAFKERDTLMKEFHILEGKIEVLQKKKS